MTVALTEHSIPELAAGLRAGTFSAVELVTETLSRIEALNPTIHAFVALSPERAVVEARRADRELREGTDRGPLHGIPYGLKDLFDAQGMATTAQSHLLQNNVAQADAEVVARLARVGAVLVGKTATYEFGIEPWPGGDTLFVAARNPRDTARITGGSSSGSAAAVAAGMVRIALGTDTGGSVRSPAGYCGVVGLKPTFGVIPTDGMIPLSPSLDHVGVLAGTVEEAALVIEAVADRVPHRDGDRGAEGLRVAYARGFFVAEASPEHLAALDDAAQAPVQTWGRGGGG